MIWFNYSSGWVALLGLAIEIGGLGFLFVDLLSSKESDREADAITFFLRDVQSSRAQLARNTARVVSMTLRVLAGLNSLEPGRPLDDAVRRALVNGLEGAKSSLPNDEAFIKAEAEDAIALAGIIQDQQRRQKRSRRLMRIARTGIGFVLIGASLQLLDLAVL